MHRILSIVIVASLAFLGCRAKELVEKEAIKADLHKRGTMDLMKEVSEDKYTAPADGKLTEAQIQMYLKVREREKVIAQEAKKDAQAHAAAADKAGSKSIAGMMEGLKTMSSAAEMLTADIRAAKDLHYNTQEYLWVKGQILAASSSAMMEKVGQTLQVQMDASYAQIKKSYDEAKDDATKKAYGEMLANMDKSKQEAAQQQKVDPALAYNRQLLAKYDSALNAVTNEMAKYEDHPGDAKKSMDEFNKNLEAQQDAAKKQ